VLVSSAEKILSACELTVADVDVYVPHQANVRIIDYATHKLGIDPDRVVVNVDRYGNTSSASVPTALDEAIEQKKLREGDILLFTALGGGLTWASATVRW
jgi:3-oxoacyl-[acyl-carrier-protein] synthase-3